MAILDRRLIPFIEMLTELGMDWLAFELIEGIRLGDEPVEKEDALALARLQVRRGSTEKFVRDASDSVVVVGEPILGDNQLEWAARIVNERFEATLAEMLASLGALDEIVDSDRGRFAKTSGPSAVIVFLDAEQDRKVSRIRVEEAQAQLGELRQCLETWLASTRSDVDQ